MPQEQPTDTDEASARKLQTLYKRKGAFDKKREELVEVFKQSPAYDELVEALKKAATKIVEKDPTILNSSRAVATVESQIWGRMGVPGPDGVMLRNIYEPELKKLLDNEEMKKDIVEKLKELESIEKQNEVNK